MNAVPFLKGFGDNVKMHIGRHTRDITVSLLHTRVNIFVLGIEINVKPIDKIMGKIAIVFHQFIIRFLFHRIPYVYRDNNPLDVGAQNIIGKILCGL